MTIEDVKRILSNLTNLDEQIANKQMEIEEMRENARGLSSPPLTGMPKGSGYVESRMATIICDYTNREQELQVELMELTLKKQKIYKLIDSVTNAKARKVLRLRYVDCLQWEEVATRVDNQKGNVYYFHRIGLKQILRILEKT